jgi:probable F420-dependent oxidoreductase
MTRPFRFATHSYATTRAGLIDEARKAEDQGYSALVFGDDLHSPLAIIPAMVTAAEATTTLRVGSYVFGNDFRHPVQLARETATLDLLTDGRLEVGIGTGWAANDYSQSGLTLDLPGVRVARLEEAIHVLKGAWRGELFSFDGKHYQTRDLIGKPLPVQRPHPPLMIGGGGRRMLSIAAREADIVSVNVRTTAAGGIDFTSLTHEATEQKIAWVRAAAGEHFDALELNLIVFNVTITDNPRRAAEETQRAYGLQEVLTVEQVMEIPYGFLGSVDQIADQIVAQRERYNLSCFTVIRGGDALAPVVARLTGR